MRKTRNTLWLAAGLMNALSAQAEDAPKGTQVSSTENETAYFLSASVPEKEMAILMKAAEARNIPMYFRGAGWRQHGADREVHDVHGHHL
ncbi:hypothetical protein [Pantoea sp. 1B4]|uniref:hypothetical protein n=1 Tax=Pantoea sp. 1B4 TaxID=2804760 RepID=UPI002D80F254|nr:hypothetical protein [Pantoea sp. 1B4]